MGEGDLETGGRYAELHRQYSALTEAKERPYQAISTAVWASFTEYFGNFLPNDTRPYPVIFCLPQDLPEIRALVFTSQEEEDADHSIILPEIDTKNYKVFTLEEDEGHLDSRLSLMDMGGLCHFDIEICLVGLVPLDLEVGTNPNFLGLSFPFDTSSIYVHRYTSTAPAKCPRYHRMLLNLDRTSRDRPNIMRVATLMVNANHTGITILHEKIHSVTAPIFPMPIDEAIATYYAIECYHRNGWPYPFLANFELLAMMYQEVVQRCGDDTHRVAFGQLTTGPRFEKVVRVLQDVFTRVRIEEISKMTTWKPGLLSSVEWDWVN